MSAADEPRTYVVGLPVVFTIYPHGDVVVKVDTGDLSKALGEHSDYPDAVVRADDELLRTWTWAHRVGSEGYAS